MLSREELVAKLKSIHLFSNLSRPQLLSLADAKLFHQVEYEAETTICYQGDPGEQYFVVIQGTLDISLIDTEARVLSVGQLGPGDSFGETSLFLQDEHDVTVKAIEPTVVLRLKKEDWTQFIEQFPEIKLSLRLRPDIVERLEYPRFPWLEKGELPIKVMYKHPAVLVPNLLIPGLLGATLAAASALAGQIWGPVAAIPGILLTLIPVFLAIYVYYDWRNDIYVVTNHRVIHRERVGLVKENFSAAPLHAIQDIQQVQIGIIARAYQYGDLVLETAGGAGQVIFRSIPQPSKIRNIIFEQKSRRQSLARASERAAVRQVMRAYFLKQDQPAPPQMDDEPMQVTGRLGVIGGIFRGFLPPLWHRQGATITWRKHWIALIRTVMLPMLIFFLITLVVAVIAVRLPDALRTVTVLYALAAFFLAPWFLWQLDDWQNDFYQVTATRIIHVERLPFFLREERREAQLEQITNVRFEQGFVGKMLKFGNVYVETSAPAGVFYLRSVSQPREVQTEIFGHIEAARRYRQEQAARKQQVELIDWFSTYDEIKKETGEEQQPTPQEETEQ